MEKKEVQHVDFSDINSIMYYGYDVQSKIVDLFKGVKNPDEKDDANIDFGSIVSFTEIIADSKKEMDRKGKSVSHKFKLALQRVGFDNVDTTLKIDYTKKYKNYMANLDNIRLELERMVQDAENDSKRRQTILNNIDKYLDELQELINIGQTDLLSFKAEIELDRSELLTHMSTDERAEKEQIIDKKNRYANTFQQRLNILRESLLLYKQQKEKIFNAQQREVEVLIQTQQYLTGVHLALEIDASVALDEAKQNQRISALSTLYQTGLAQLELSAKISEQQTRDSIALLGNSGISETTILRVQQSVDNSRAAYQEYLEQKNFFAETHSAALSLIEASADLGLPVAPSTEESQKVRKIGRIGGSHV